MYMLVSNSSYEQEGRQYMTIKIIQEYEVEDLGQVLWEGGLETFNTLKEHNRLEKLDKLLTGYCSEEVPYQLDLNDYMWFNRGLIYEYCGLSYEGEEVEVD